MKMTKLASLFILGLFLHSVGHGKETNPQKKYDSIEIRLTRTGAVNLQIADNFLIGRVTEFIVSENSIFINDYSSNKVYEFDQHGMPVTIIGKVGQGPGEYLNPRSIACSENGVYIYDVRSRRLLFFDNQRNFSDDLNSQKNLASIQKILCDRNGDLIILHNDYGVARIAKYYESKMNKAYMTTMTKVKLNSLVLHFSKFTGFVYNPRLDHIYFLEPGDYRVKVIDNETGKLVNIFGARPDSYVEKSKADLNMGEISDPRMLSKILNESHFLWGGMFLVKKEYLFVGLSNRKEGNLRYRIYDVQDGSCVATFRHDALGENKVLFTDNNNIYIYAEPSEEELGSSNGKIEIYAVEIKGL